MTPLFAAAAALQILASVSTAGGAAAPTARHTAPFPSAASALKLPGAAPEALPPTATSPAAQAAAEPAAPAGEDAADDEGDDESGPSEEAESESATPGEIGPPGLRYSGDLDDAELRRRFQQDLASLGTISVGFADRGRVINAVHLENGDAWICARSDLAWGTRETVESLKAAFRAVHAQFPGSAPARLSHIGAREGGYLKPHRSHQSGRDADIGFFYKNDAAPGGRNVHREKLIDPERNWALLRALITKTDVQFILVDRGIQKVLREEALALGEDRAWVDRIFRGGEAALVKHARHHRDHFHVRFYAPRSQELGRRIQPLLALRPDQNLAVHRVKGGQTLGAIARSYKTTVPAILKANHLRRSFLHVGQRLVVPLRGPCTRCPLPPPVGVPPRCLPPQTLASATAPPASATVLATAIAHAMPVPDAALAGRGATSALPPPTIPREDASLFSTTVP